MGPVQLCLVCLLVNLSPLSASRHHLSSFMRTRSTKILAHGPSYDTKYYTQRLDHFNVADDRTFQQRYLVNKESWKEGKGPIFIYTGNEGDITWFYNNTGIVGELATHFNALLLFIEHRYYGESLPFGADSFKGLDHLGYLTAEQALADFATLITHFKSSELQNASGVPTIALGGSYGGMLAAWLRMKYPHVVIGAFAASAPIMWFSDLTPCNSAYKTITKDFEQATVNWPHNNNLCSDTISKSWAAIDRAGHQGAAGLETLTKTFHLCDKLTKVQDLTDWLEDTWFNMAMVDYPYPASFLEPLPAWPINVTCKYLSSKFSTDTELLAAVALAVDVYYNYTGEAECYNVSSDATASLGSQGWGIQACTEMVMPMCSDGVTDMFTKQPWDLAAYEKDCMKTYGLKPQPDLIKTMFGGRDIKDHSNIMFSNGLLDPWHGGGVLQSVSDSLVAVVIPNGAHHLDLRRSSSSDPVEVQSARKAELSYISKWLDDYTPPQ